jgi:hypothetical protein|tara:strand:+ start:876 stop:1169 length:294 start_codon:yes stop_codon:yes gene_type:complete
MPRKRKPLKIKPERINNLGIQRLDTYTYRDRDEYYGADSKYRYRPDPRTRMPGTSPPFERRSLFEKLLQKLKIIPTPKKRKERPVIKSYQDRYKGLI